MWTWNNLCGIIPTLCHNDLCKRANFDLLQFGVSRWPSSAITKKAQNMELTIYLNNHWMDFDQICVKMNEALSCFKILYKKTMNHPLEDFDRSWWYPGERYQAYLSLLFLTYYVINGTSRIIDVTTHWSCLDVQAGASLGFFHVSVCWFSDAESHFSLQKLFHLIGFINFLSKVFMLQFQDRILTNKSHTLVKIISISLV